MVEGIVEIERLRLFARHGVARQERIVGNIFEVTARLRYDMQAAAESDDVAFALDYSTVAETIGRVMAEPCNLLETVVVKLRNAIVEEFPEVLGGEIRLAKLKPPMPGAMSSVSISLKW